MTYNPDQLTVERIHASALLGYTMRLDESNLGDTTSTRTLVPVSSCSISNGYSVGTDGELSLDPSTASIGLADWTSGPITATAPVRPGDGVEIHYAGTLLFKGTASSVTVSIDTGDAFIRGADYTRAWSASLTGIEGLLLAREITWDQLLEEPALDRLKRWFVVDTATVPPAHTKRMNPVQQWEDAGTAPLIELARQFTAVTRLPVRLTAPYTSARDLEVVDNALDWSDDPLTAKAGFTASAGWSTAVDYTDGEPSSMAVKGDDMRFIGFRPPDNVDVHGKARPVARIVHTFGHQHYAAVVELAPRIRWLAGG
jgi:hypothetical protein